MAITSEYLQITVRGVLLGQKVQVSQWYRAAGIAFSLSSAEAVGNAYWQNIKTAWRATHLNFGNDRTESILVSEPGGFGEYGTYSIPLSEQIGTHAGVAGDNQMPSFVSAGVKLNVSTRVTRPGQKRFWGLMESFQTDGVLNSTYIALVDTLAGKFSGVIALGEPVLAGSLEPYIMKINPLDGSMIVGQPVSGHTVSFFVTSQNSRKVGRGQ